MMTDPCYVPDIHQELRSGQPWSNPGLKSVVLLAWGVTLRQLNQYQTPTGKGGSRGGGIADNKLTTQRGRKNLHINLDFVVSVYGRGRKGHDEPNTQSCSKIL